MKKNKCLYGQAKTIVLLRVFVGLTLTLFALTACSDESKLKKVAQEPSTEVVTEVYVPTPQEALDRVSLLITDEMRVFDVNEHHDQLYEIIKKESIGLEEEEIKPLISSVINNYMDDYFKNLIREQLSEYNEQFSSDEVETIFNNTSRTALYELIALYEWTYYQKSVK